MNREQAGNALAARRRGNEPRHPVIAVNEIRLDAGNDVVDHLALERQRQLDVSVALRIDRVPIIEATVFRKVYPLVGKMRLVFAQFVRDQLRRLDVEHATIVGQRDMHVGPQQVQSLHKRRRNVSHAACLGGHLARQVPHALRKIGNLRSDNENPRILRPLFPRHRRIL